VLAGLAGRAVVGAEPVGGVRVGGELAEPALLGAVPIGAVPIGAARIGAAWAGIVRAGVGPIEARRVGMVRVGRVGAVVPRMGRVLAGVRLAGVAVACPEGLRAPRPERVHEPGGGDRGSRVVGVVDEPLQLETHQPRWTDLEAHQPDVVLGGIARRDHVTGVPGQPRRAVRGGARATRP
jgi:hypothetical protein